MQKLIYNYITKPTAANARRLVDYSDKHPMAVCMIDIEGQRVLSAAIDHHHSGERHV